MEEIFALQFATADAFFGYLSTREIAECPAFEDDADLAFYLFDPSEYASWAAWESFKSTPVTICHGTSAFKDFKNKTVPASDVVFSLLKPHQRRKDKDGPAICGGRLWSDADAPGSKKNLTDARIADVSLVIFEVDSGQSPLNATKRLEELHINHLVTSTFSDGGTEREVGHDELLKHMMEREREGSPDMGDVTAYLLAKGRVTEDLARSVRGEVTLAKDKRDLPAWGFQTDPCPKFRIYIFLETPFPIFEPGKIGRNDKLFSTFYNALADELGILHDKSCANVARLQYLPSVRLNGPHPYSRFVPGYPYDWRPLTERIEVETASKPKQAKRKEEKRTKPNDFTTKNLFRFGVSCSTLFAVEEFVADVATMTGLDERGGSNAGGCCFECPNEKGEVSGRPHTTSGGSAFWVCNGWNRTDGGEDFIVKCSTDGCSEHFEGDRLRYLDALCQRAGIEDAEKLLAFTNDDKTAREAYAAWERFRTNNDGRPYPSQHNIRIALRRLGVTVSFNEFDGKTYVEGLEGFGPYLDDAALDRLWLTIDCEFHFRSSKEFFHTVVSDEARLNSKHPVREYLDGVQRRWDGVSRVDTWMTTYLGAEDTPLNRAVGRIFLTACVRRIRSPGCKFDEMLVFESAQGKGKSTALAVLAVREEWFTDSVSLNASPKEVIEQTLGRWIVEIPEMVGGRKAQIEAIKAFLSRQEDSSRLAYGRTRTSVRRSFICSGTTNEPRYLKDLTGNRRFWPVSTGEIDLEALRRDRDQLWAEAATMEAAGESIRLDQELWDDAADAQKERHVENPYESILTEKLGNLTGKISAESVYQLVEVKAPQRTPTFFDLISSAMKTLGWEKKKIRFKDQPLQGFRKGEGADAELPTLKAAWDDSERASVVRKPIEPNEGLSRFGGR